MTILLAIGIFYGGMLFGILVMALCVSASDQRAQQRTWRLTLITYDPHTGQQISERTMILPHAHAEN